MSDDAGMDKKQRIIRSLLLAGRKLKKLSFLVIPLIFCCLFFFRLASWWQEEPVRMTTKKTVSAIVVGTVLGLMLFVAGIAPLLPAAGKNGGQLRIEENEIPNGRAVIYWDEAEP